MQEAETKNESRLTPSFGRRAYDVLSGFGLATILLLLMGLLTWFATLEQIDNGLHATLRKYFSWQAWYVVPEIKGKMVPLLLPGGYWTGALLLVNMTLGGIVRARKGWKHVGNLIAHAGIIFMLVAGGVAHHFEVRGNMAIEPGKSNDAAEDYFEHVVEISELDEQGDIKAIHVIRGEYVMDLAGGKSRTIRLPQLPFDLELAGYEINAAPMHQFERAPRKKELVVDGYYLLGQEPEVEAERNSGGCYARVIHRNGDKSEPFILSALSFYHHTVEHEGKYYAINMRKRLWPMPFELRLDEFSAEFHPGTQRPAKFVSEVTRIENDTEAKVTIQMNEPLRYEGLTFYQASYGPRGAGPNEDLFTVLEVVSNPADKWPEYSLYIVTFGMLVAFVTKLTIYLVGQSRRKSP
jgi:hypothetical protein